MLFIVRDLRLALRRLAHDRGFGLTCILTLAIALGANAAMLAVVDSVLWKPLPVPESERLVTVSNQYPGAGVPYAGSSVPHFYERQEIDALGVAALARTDAAAVGEGGRAQQMQRYTVTVDYFDMVRTEAATGRTFRAEDGEVGANRVVVLTHEAWRDTLGGAPDAIGSMLRVDDVPHEVIGILPPGHMLYEPDVRLYTPVAFDAEDRAFDRRHSNNWMMIARLAPGATRELAQQQIDAQVRVEYENAGGMRQMMEDVGFGAAVRPLRDVVLGDIDSTLYLLWGGVLAVLLIAVVNLTNLSLARTSVRLKDLVTRYTLGAGGAGLVRQLAIESLALAALGGVLGIVCGRLGLLALGRLGMDQMPRGSEIALDGGVIAVTFVLAAGIGLVLAVVPVLSVLRANMAAVLREEGRSGTASRGARRLRQGLVAAQVAFAFVLIAGAGLLLASFQRLVAVDPGYHADDVLLASVALPPARYEEAEDLAHFAQRTVERLRALPGVDAAGLAYGTPMSGAFDSSVIVAEGWQPAPGESLFAPTHVSASAGYLEALDIELLAGRAFTDADTGEATRVALVDPRLARRFWGEEAVTSPQSVLGRRLFRPQSTENLLDPGPDPEWITVVGVVGDTRLRQLSETEGDAVGVVYFPYAQFPRRSLAFAVETGLDPLSLGESVRREVAAVDPELPVFDQATLRQRLDRSLVSRRTPMILAVGFGVVALLLASIGIYGVLAYLVARRSRELGIRMALGSTTRGLFRLILREGFVIVLFGLGIGLGGAVALRNALAGQLYGVGALDPLVLSTAVFTLAVAAFLACAIPGLRAARVDPSEALRE